MNPLTEKVLRVLSRYDLSALRPGIDTPSDEYRPEATELASLLESSAVTAGHIRDVWRRWFADDLARVDRATLETLAAELNALR